MKLQTHVAFGIFLGVVFYYIFNLDLTFVLLVGFVAFIPDIDLTIQRWRKRIAEKNQFIDNLDVGLKHRTFTHNVWAMLIILVFSLFFTRNIIFLLGIAVGFISHLIADSFTVSGVYWLWPYGEKFGKQGKFYVKGKINMTNPNEIKIERIIQIVLLTLSGFLFFIKGQVISKIFSLDGLITIGVFLFAGFILMKNFGNVIVKTIRRLKI